MVIADINEDKIDDIIISIIEKQHIKIFLNSESGNLTNENIHPTQRCPWRRGSGRFFQKPRRHGAEETFIM
jgi:hypothetical protein